MNYELIKSGVLSMEGLEALNEMQRAMMEDDSRRVMLTAPTGSGKTIAFAIRLLREIEVGREGVQGVVLAPTRELVVQIAGVLRKIAGGAARCVALYGGHAMREEVNELRVVPAVVVATPGRLADHINRRNIDVSGARVLVIDEFDKCLQLGFQEDMARIVRRLKRLRLMVLTSATRGGELPEFVGDADSYRRYDFGGACGEGCVAGVSATMRTDDTVSPPVPEIEVVEVRSGSRDKLAALGALLRAERPEKCIVFVNHRESAERVYEYLRREGADVVLYHGGLDQQQRKMAVELLANGSRPVMVATDLAARGLDLPAIDAVVHYHQPGDAETWTHRNGRTARQGGKGTAYVIVEEGSEGSDKLRGDRSEMRVAGLPALPLPRGKWATVYINAGKKEKISRGDIAGYLMKKGGLSREQVGRIAVDDHYSLVAVPEGEAAAVVAALRPHKLKGQRVKVSVVNS